MSLSKLPKSAVLSGLNKVPPFPPVAARLLTLLAKESVDLNEVADLVRSDAALSARVLQCVNSVEYGLPQEIKEVRSALAFLGLDRTRQVTVTLATRAYAKGSLGAPELRHCWEHTLATAILADEIARSCQLFTDVAYTAGIIHDIGRLGLMVAYPREYESIIRDAAERCIDLLDFETEQFGVHHAEAGRILSERWGLPEEFRIVAGRHHDRPDTVELDLLGIVHAACRLADVLGFHVTSPLVSESMDDVLAAGPSSVRKHFQESPEQLRARIEQRLSAFDRMDTGGSVQQMAVDRQVPREVPRELPAAVFLPSTPRRPGFLIVLGLAITLVTAVLLWRNW